jgi:glycosyltransferase involved in cell wall biosynthesis
MESLQPIKERYLEISHIELYLDDNGRRSTTYLQWQTDLIGHMRYLSNFSLASPLSGSKQIHPVYNLEANPDLEGIHFFDLPAGSGNMQTLLHIPSRIIKLFQAIKQNDIIHVTTAAGLIPNAWLAVPLARILKKRLVVIVESAFWRIPNWKHASVKTRIFSFISEAINRWCVNCADISIFTQEEYYRSLLTKRRSRGNVIPASWINESDIISNDDAEKLWQKKLSETAHEFKILYAGSLTSDKGILVLLEAVKILESGSSRILLDIIGKGDLLSLCKEVARKANGQIHINVLDTIPYGSQFFQLIREYHAVVVPSITDEQPRIVYDAYCQAVPSLASHTSGLHSCVSHGETGMLVKPNDPHALAELLTWASNNLNQLKTMGLAGIEKAKKMTFRQMHEKRWKLILQMLGGDFDIQ